MLLIKLNIKMRFALWALTLRRASRLFFLTLMFSLKKELGIAKVICKPLVLVPKTAQKSCLSKLGEMAHV